MTIRRERELRVVKKIQLTPNMMRIILGGEDLHDFPEGQESGYIKLLLPQEENTVKRSYTIRAFDAVSQELTLDFVVHGDNGPASAWAMTVSAGDLIAVDGPGAKKLVSQSGDWFFIAGDMTALPAISVNLESLPEHAQGYAVIEILDEQDKQAINTAKDMNIHWVVNPKPDQPNSVLVDAVTALPWKDGVPNIWVASEFEAMRALRRYFKQERKVDRNQIYASSYWKMGASDEGNKAAKKMDLEAD